MTTIDDLPNPDETALARSQAMTEYIRKEADQHQGLISFATFMEHALYHPQLGYYNAETFALGKQGDFTTAPEISPLFAQCFAKQIQQIFSELSQANLLELGAGTGRLAYDLLSELQQLNCLPERYYIYEISIQLRKKQQAYLQTACPDLFPRIIWLDQLPQHFKGCVIANEVLDALPVHRFRVESNSVSECCVKWKDTEFTWEYRAFTAPEFNAKAEEIRNLYQLSEGYESEMNLGLRSFIQALAQAIDQGVIFFVDYGYGQQEYYHPQRAQGTLTCFYKHMRHENPLIFPGLQDITAHVDFTSVIENAVDFGLELEGYTSQAAFLLSLGLLDLAAKQTPNLSPAEEVKLNHAIKLLTLPTEMGDRIKVMALSKDMNKKEKISLLGFKLQDRRRDL